jgi:hypothetical protein
MKYIYLLYVKIICIFWAYKLGLKYRELRVIFLALEIMIQKKYDRPKET